MKVAARLALTWDLLRAEGPAAVRDRLLDRLAGWRRRRSFRLAGELRPPFPEDVGEPFAEVLNVLPTAPRPEWGGVQLQLLRRLEAEAAARPWALLYPEARGYRLELRDGQRRQALTFRVPVELRPDRLDDPGFADVVRHAARRVGARTVHFENLVGLPLASVAGLPAAGLALIASVHDFGLFCVRPHLMERPWMRFCDFCRAAGRCGSCLRHDWPVADGFQEERREVAAELLRAAAAVVYPSVYLRRTYADLVAGLDAARQHVVAPPAVTEPAQVEELRRGPVRHLAYVGSVQPHKGALIFEEVVRQLLAEGHSDLRFSVYGGGDREILRRLRRLPRVRLAGYYRAGELPRRLHRDGVDLALLLSIWPESYALTLDECLAAGVPAMAFDLGAPAERLRRCGAEGLIVPQTSAAAAVRRLRAILAGEHLPDLPRPFSPSHAAAAAAACRRVYESLASS